MASRASKDKQGGQEVVSVMTGTHAPTMLLQEFDANSEGLRAQEPLTFIPFAGDDTVDKQQEEGGAVHFHDRAESHVGDSVLAWVGWWRASTKEESAEILDACVELAQHDCFPYTHTGQPQEDKDKTKAHWCTRKPKRNVQPKRTLQRKPKSAGHWPATNASESGSKRDGSAKRSQPRVRCVSRPWLVRVLQLSLAMCCIAFAITQVGALGTLLPPSGAQGKLSKLFAEEQKCMEDAATLVEEDSVRALEAHEVVLDKLGPRSRWLSPEVCRVASSKTKCTEWCMASPLTCLSLQKMQV